MNKSRHKVAALLVLLATFAHGPAQAAPKRVEAFDGNVWREIQVTLKQPTVILFSATWCPNCPAVMENLAREIKQRKRPAQLLTVVMDVAPGEADAALIANPHYRLADHLFAFAGQKRRDSVRGRSKVARAHAICGFSGAECSTVFGHRAADQGEL
ncbi:MAG: thioredoxin family protein [Rhodocyclaceae bacterium]|nr:thioredoxin family protein [Rhodocyclaceae bacterium]